MTKMKSKKMTKSTFAIIIMAIAMVAMLAFGGTYAYFTATAGGDTATTNTAVIKLTADGTIDTEKLMVKKVTENALPGEEVFSVGATLTDDSTRNTYIFAKIEVKFGDTAVDLATGKAGALSVLDIAWTEQETWTAVGETAANVFYVENTTNDKRGDGEAKTYAVTMTVKLSEDLHENFNTGDGETEEDLVYMGQEVTITIEFSAIQKGEFANAGAAYAEIAKTVSADTNEPTV